MTLHLFVNLLFSIGKFMNIATITLIVTTISLVFNLTIELF